MWRADLSCLVFGRRVTLGVVDRGRLMRERLLAGRVLTRERVLRDLSSMLLPPCRTIPFAGRLVSKSFPVFIVSRVRRLEMC